MTKVLFSLLIFLQFSAVLFSFLYYFDLLSIMPLESIGNSLSKLKNDYLFSAKTKKGTPLSQCILPKYDPFDSSLTPYVNYRMKDTFRNCSNPVKMISEYDKKGVLSVKDKTMNCSARCFSQGKKFRQVDSGKWILLKKGKAALGCEFVEVVCPSKENVSLVEYSMLHMQMKPRKKRPQGKEKEGKRKRYDVHVLLLDSTASGAAERTLPLTLRFMEKSMEAVTFPFVNRIGLNSRPNAFALFFGKQVEKIERSVLEMPSIEPEWPNACEMDLDNISSIFHDFQNSGYRTLLTDDWHKGVLHYRICRAWSKPVVDHTFDPFIQMAYRKPYKYNFFGPNCGFIHREDLRFLRQFIDTYPEEPKFSWSWLTDLVHEKAEGAFLMDVDITNFLMENRAKMDESFFIIMADHGIRVNRIRKTKLAGSLEVNNPMLTISLPKDLRNKEILSILKENAAKLQTHYDTRATLLDILRYQPLANYSGRSPLSIEGEKGNSFLRRQEDERNCLSLPISFPYCICQFEEESLDVNSSLSLEFGNAVINEINDLLKTNNLTDVCNLWKMGEVTEITGFAPVEETGAVKITVTASWPYKKASFRTFVHRSSKGEMVVAKLDRTDKYKNRGACAAGMLESICDCKTNKIK